MREAASYVPESHRPIDARRGSLRHDVTAQARCARVRPYKITRGCAGERSSPSLFSPTLPTTMPLVEDATSQVLAVDLYLSVPAHDRSGVVSLLYCTCISLANLGA